MRVKLLAAAIAGSLVAGGALAADLPAPKSPPAYRAPPPVWSWTGCSIGANAGYGWRSDSAYDPELSTGAGGDTAGGFVGGGQIGCDYQISAWVFGVQGMFDGTSLEGSHLYPGSATETLKFDSTWLATETARIGYVIAPQTLLYLRGGLAETSVSYKDDDPSVSATSPYFGTASATRVGGTIGGGLEYAFTRNWSAFVEYDYAGFGGHDTTLTYTAPNPANATPYAYRETHDFQSLLVGLNFRFGGDASPPPVAARY
jgi:outer membrane immunogenic protein